MTISKKADELINAIERPLTVSEHQANIAKKFVKARMLEGFTVQKFCSENSISTKTIYEWQENIDFKKYLQDLQSAIIPDDERQAFDALKKHLLKIPYKQAPSVKEVELFMDVFGYVAEADKRERMEALGISDTVKPNTEKSLAEKKASLLSRLKGID